MLLKNMKRSLLRNNKPPLLVIVNKLHYIVMAKSATVDTNGVVIAGFIGIKETVPCVVPHGKEMTAQSMRI